jgi:DnaK suppressor protein
LPAVSSGKAGASDADLVAALRAERERTTARVSDLERDLAAISESTAAGPDDEHDAEGSTVGYERARVGSLLTQARRHLEAVELALGRAATGGLGRCAACGEPIGLERLQALPATTRCVRCAAR